MAGDPGLSALRRQVAHETADWLAAFGLLLWRVNWLDDGVAGIAVATQMVGQIGQEAADAYDKERYYAGSCLTRQLVEAHYLLAYFQSDTSQAARWRRASKNRLEKSFKPSQLREVLGMDGGDYRTHCSLGGHPTPQAAWLLPDHQPLVDHELHWVDLQQHLTDAVVRSLRVSAALGDERLGDSLAKDFEQPPLSITEWLSVDPLAQKVSRGEAERVMSPYLLNRQVPPAPPRSVDSGRAAGKEPRQAESDAPAD